LYYVKLILTLRSPYQENLQVLTVASLLSFELQLFWELMNMFLPKSIVVLAAGVALLAACETKPLTPEQTAALAEKENCTEVTGSHLRRCAGAIKDSGVKSVSGDAVRSMVNSSSSGTSRVEGGPR
jgi:hypothetical protein